jgi:chromosome segregation ATPase
MKTRNIGLALLLVAALGSQTMLGLTAHEITRNRDAISRLLKTDVSANQAENDANIDKLRTHRDTLKKAKKLTNEAEITNKINDFRYGKTRAEQYQESLDIQATGGAVATACTADLGKCQDLVKDKNKQIEDEQQKRIDASDKLNQAEKELASAQAGVAARESEISMLKADVVRLEKKLTDATTKQAATQGELSQCTTITIPALQKELASAKEDASTSGELLAESNNELQAETAKVTGVYNAAIKAETKNRKAGKNYKDLFETLVEEIGAALDKNIKQDVTDVINVG